MTNHFSYQAHIATCGNGYSLNVHKEYADPAKPPVLELVKVYLDIDVMFKELRTILSPLPHMRGQKPAALRPVGVGWSEPGAEPSDGTL